MTNLKQHWTEASLAAFLSDLEQAALDIVSEHNLLQRLENDLALLADAQRQQSQLFGPSQEQSIQNLNDLVGSLAEFKEVQEDMQIIVSRDDYDDAMERLEDLFRVLGGKAVQKRVARERRELQTQLPRLRQAEAARVKRQIEKTAPNCKKGHLMTLRQGDDGWFWGCTRYPKCRVTKELAEEHETALRLSHN